jgi:hypothetical protein
MAFGSWARCRGLVALAAHRAGLPAPLPLLLGSFPGAPLLARVAALGGAGKLHLRYRRKRRANGGMAPDFGCWGR